MFYGQSKLANAVYARELARRLEARGIGVNTIEPGAVRGTRIAQHLPLPMRVLHALASPFMKSACQGAATAALLAASPAANGISGELWANCRRINGAPLLDDLEIAARLWRISEQIVASRSRIPAAAADEAATPEDGFALRAAAALDDEAFAPDGAVILPAARQDAAVHRAA